MFGAMTKTYYAEKMGIDPKDIVVVSIIPCTAKKFEISRENQAASGYPDVDIALTTREPVSYTHLDVYKRQSVRTASLISQR